MSRRSGLWLAAAVGLAAVLAYLLASRRSGHQALPVVAAWAPDPGPAAAPAVSAAAVPVPVPAAGVPAAPVQAAPALEGEQPLPTWVRVAIVGAALAAFFAVSLIATRNV